jgi:hypothetical protein
MHPLCTAVTLTLLLAFVAPPGTARAEGPCGNAGSLPDTPPTTAFFENDRMLGPDPLPQGKPVSPMLTNFQRFGTTPEDQWKTKYIGVNSKTKAPDWNWPPSDKYPDGFDTKPDGKTPDRTRTTLKPGTRLDRFGYATGKFLAPPGTPFTSRALPPQALDTPDHSVPDYEGRINVQNLIIPPSNYHVYCVQNAFDVDAGPIAPWFDQAGKGQQFLLMKGYAPDQEDNVLWLLSHGPNGAKGVSNAYLVEQLP